MKITRELLLELQNRLKVGSRRGVHLNAIPGKSRYKFDISRLSNIDKDIPKNFLNALLSKPNLKFKISWKDNVPDLNLIDEENQIKLVKITRSFQNLINQTKVIESEKGVNTFGFGYPLLIRRDESDNKITVAPILIWSLKIRRTKEFNTWEILRTDEDSIYINEVLINHIYKDSNIKIEQLSSEILDDGFIDKDNLLHVCIKLIKSVNSKITGDVESNFEKKINEVKKIPTKQYLEELSLLGPNNSIVHFGGLFSIFEVQKQNIIKDYDYLFDLKNEEIDLSSMEKHFFQPISSIETDPSQQSILNALESTRNLLIQGPPGTGKSQSLTSILINALENNKKTIVVCEKKAALDVLKEALADKGLENQFTLINDIVSDRREVVESVRNRTQNEYFGNNARNNLDYLIKNTNQCINSINNKHIKLSKKILDDKNWTDTVGMLLSESKNFSELTDIKLKNLNFSYEPNELNKFIDILDKGKNLYNDYKGNQELSFINPKKYLDKNPFLIEKELQRDFLEYKSEIDKIQNLVSRYKGLYYDIRLREFENQRLKFKEFKEKLNKILLDANDLLSGIKRRYFSIRIDDFNNQYNSVIDEIKQVDVLYKSYKEYESLLLNKEELNSYSYKFKSLFSKKIKSVKKACETIDIKIDEIESQLSHCEDLDNFKFNKNLKEKKKDFYKLIEILKSQKLNFKTSVDNEIHSMKLSTFLDDDINNQTCITELGLLKNKKSNLKDHKNVFSEFQNTLIEIEQRILSAYKNTKQFTVNAKDLKTIGYPKSLNQSKDELLRYEEYLNKLENDFRVRLNKEIKTLEVSKCDEPIYENDTLKEIKKGIDFLKQKFIKDNWVIEKISFDSEIGMARDFNNLFKKCDIYFNHEENLLLNEYKWLEYYNSLTVTNKKLVDQLKGRNDWVKIFKIHYLKSLLDDEADMNLPTDNKDYDDLDKKLNDFQTEQLNYIKQFWLSKQKKAIRDFQEKHSGFSVNNIYNHRKSRNFKRLSLREIVKYDLDFFTTMFPVILTTPDVCSNLFKSKNKYFDIIMFDEASQLKLEHTLPALLKGKQIVIAGDEHQMPPSNYFSPILEGEIEDEDDIEDDEITVDANNMLLSCESLLDFATEFKFEKKYLDFHYRSEHPYLIDFSNYAFYNQRLKPKPNEIDYTPIKYIPVNGTYSDNSNEVEAETVLSIIDKNIQRLPDGKYPSVGVATFNISQRNLIMDKIIERSKFNKYSNFNKKILELKESGFFVKNLENIQGDERDIIILSTTYGINKDGVFQNRFGPINFAKGYKLLNVIITRAKYKIYLCSSVPEEKFLHYKDYLNIEGSNNRRGVLFAYLAYSKAVSEGNNELRESVLKALAENTNKESGILPFHQDLESPFEEEVYQALIEHFSQDNIIPQHQFAGFRIDIVYDPKHLGLPKIAIECDGATYHSSREAYLHDRHRQKILENHGFVFHRIWSTNWWENPKRETKKLVSFIKNIENSNPSIFIDKSNVIGAFTDDVVITESNFLNDSSSLEKKIDDTTKILRNQNLVQMELFENNEKPKKYENQEDKIKLHSKVIVKYLNKDAKIKVYLVDEQITSTEKINGYQKINIKSSLGVCLLGKKKGDVERVGKGDYYVEVLKILN